jgi:cell division protein FtsB
MLASYAIAALLALIVLLLAFAVWGIFKKEERARRAVEDQQAELAMLEERKAVLEANLAELGTERGREAVVRQNHGVAKAGEEVIIVVPPEEDDLDPHLPWYRKILGWFGMW